MSKTESKQTDNLGLPLALKIKHAGVRASVRNVGDALRLIEQDLPAELRHLPRWEFAYALLRHVASTGKKNDLNNALRQLRQALSDEGWLSG